MRIPPVVDRSWLSQNDEDVVLVDVRWYPDGRDGQAAYESAHLPGAVWVDIDTDLSGPSVPGGARHPLPTPEAFAEALGRRGIADGATVVAYDDTSGAFAARLVWLLRLIGRDAAILSGGLTSWPGETVAGIETREPVTRTVVPWPAERIVDADALLSPAGDATTGSLVDARAQDRYSGDARFPLDARHGHIPGAINIPWAANLDANGEFLDPEALRGLYADRGVDLDHDDGVTVYCGSGVTACADLLALEHAGVSGARLYPGSWSEWGGDPSKPLESGSTAGA